MPTLLELIDDGLIDPGEQEVVASYKGSALTANLTRDGAIVYGCECVWGEEGKAEGRAVAAGGSRMVPCDGLSIGWETAQQMMCNSCSSARVEQRREWLGINGSFARS
jgi:hypothetical protein